MKARVIILLCMSFFSIVKVYSIESLTLERALIETRIRSPHIQKGESVVEQSHWQQVEAFSPFLPKLFLTADHYFRIKYQTLSVSLLGPPVDFPFISPATIYSLNASWSLFNGWQDAHRLSAAKLRSRASHLDLEWTRFQVNQTVRLSFYRALAAKMLAEVANENIKNLTTHLKQIRDMLHAGESTEVSVLRVQVQLSNAKSQKLNADDQVLITLQQLAQAMGGLTEPRALEGDLPLPNADIVKKIEEANAGGRPDLDAMTLRTEAAVKTESAAKNFWIPSISLVGNFNFYNNRSFEIIDSVPFRSAYQYGVELSWNIFDGLYSYARSREAVAQTQAALKDEEIARLQVATDFATYRNTYQYQLSQFTTNIENLDRSKKSVQLALAGLRAGTQTSTDVLDAELDLFNARAGVIQAQLSAVESQISFENAIGSNL